MQIQAEQAKSRVCTRTNLKSKSRQNHEIVIKDLILTWDFLNLITLILEIQNRFEIDFMPQISGSKIVDFKPKYRVNWLLLSYIV